jgi:hypothetical protein
MRGCPGLAVEAIAGGHDWSSSCRTARGMLANMSRLFRWLTSILFAAVVIQVGLAGYGAFDAIHKAKSDPVNKKALEDSFGAHGVFGYLVLLVMLFAFIVAASGGLGPAKNKWTGGDPGARAAAGHSRSRVSIGPGARVPTWHKRPRDLCCGRAARTQDLDRRQDSRHARYFLTLVQSWIRRAPVGLTPRSIELRHHPLAVPVVRSGIRLGLRAGEKVNCTALAGVAQSVRAAES